MREREAMTGWKIAVESRGERERETGNEKKEERKKARGRREDTKPEERSRRGHAVSSIHICWTHHRTDPKNSFEQVLMRE